QSNNFIHIYIFSLFKCTIIYFHLDQFFLILKPLAFLSYLQTYPLFYKNQLPIHTAPNFEENRKLQQIIQIQNFYPSLVLILLNKNFESYNLKENLLSILKKFLKISVYILY